MRLRTMVTLILEDQNYDDEAIKKGDFSKKPGYGGFIIFGLTSPKIYTNALEEHLT